METVPVKIIKASGQHALYSGEKLIRSLEKSGASQAIIKEVLSRVHKELYEGITTKQIYKLAYKLIKQMARPVAGRYKLKQAIFELGPTGYPFEKFVGEILKNQGFETEVGVLVQGKCVTHEVDVIARKPEMDIYIECKFHNSSGRKTDIKVPLYVNSRIIDITDGPEEKANKIQKGWLVTNTRFSTDALTYGNCTEKIDMIGWDFPKKGNLADRIAFSGLFPITCMTRLSRKQKQSMLDQGIVLCKDLLGSAEIEKMLHLPPTSLEKVLNEAREISQVFGKSN